MSLTRFLKKHYGAQTDPLNGRLICSPPVYLSANGSGTYTKHDQRPEGKYLCFFSSDAREDFLKRNKN
jgi:hypothetical protein